jgi:hypothetical protein
MSRQPLQHGLARRLTPYAPKHQRKLQEVEVRDGDRALTSAEVSTSTEADGTARISLHAESGHLPPGSRSELVDAVLDLPDVRDSAHLEATLPAGDSESLQRLRERTEDMSTRSAGSSALVEADLPHELPAGADGTQTQEEELT